MGFQEGSPRHVGFVYMGFVGSSLPHKRSQIAFDLSVNKQPLQRFSQVQAMIDEQSPLPRGWVQVTQAVCLDAHYYQAGPLFGEESMPKRKAQEHGRTVHARRPRSPPPEEYTDIVHQCTAADFVLEAVSPAQTTSQFVYEVARVQDGAYAMAFVDLIWVESTKASLRSLRDPATFEEARKTLREAALE